MDRETQLRVLAKRFGFCGCKSHCQIEQYGEDGADGKPRGRLSVCELEADQHKIPVPEPEEDEDP